jgi:hypothetical protein
MPQPWLGSLCTGTLAHDYRGVRLSPDSLIESYKSRSGVLATAHVMQDGTRPSTPQVRFVGSFRFGLPIALHESASLCH